MEVNNLNVQENFKVNFEISCVGEEWREFLSKASAAMQKQKAVPGFRAGKAPLNVAIKTYGDELIKRAAGEAAQKLFTDVCNENNFAPVSVPKIMTVTATADELMTVNSFTTYPVVKEMQYKGLKVEKPVKTCTEEEIDAAIDRYMHQHYYVHEVPRAAAMGDIVQVDFTGTCNGEHFEYDHSKKSRFTMGSGQLFAGLDEALVGHVANDHLSISLTMPEDFHRDAVAGKTLDLEVNVQGVWARDLLECTDEYVKENVKDCETLADFREKNRKQIQDRYDRETRSLFEKRTAKALADAVPCEIPEEMIETALARYVGTLRSLASQQGKTAEKLLEEEGKTMQDFLTTCRPSATQQVKESIALDYIVQVENVQVTRDELDRHFNSAAAVAKISVEEAKRREGGEDAYFEKLLNNKAMQIVRKYVDATEVTVEGDFPKE